MCVETSMGVVKYERRAESSVTERLGMGLEEKGAWDQSQISQALDVRERERGEAIIEPKKE